MFLSKQININNYNLREPFNQQPTENLLNDILFCFDTNAIPLLTPLGIKIVRNMENTMMDIADNYGMEQIEPPTIIDNNVLEQGQEIGQQFRSKIMYLSGKMEGFHLMMTPEPLFIKVLSDNNLSHSQLPLRYVYSTNFYRNMADPRHFLRGKQFKMFGGFSVDTDRNSLIKSSEMFDSLTQSIFSTFRLPFYKQDNGDKLMAEYFYLSEAGKENVYLPQIDESKKTKALSLAMYYHYTTDKPVKLKYTNSENKKVKPLFLTYGMGTQRTLFSIMDVNRDEYGFNLPECLRPFDYVVIPLQQKLKPLANMTYERMKSLGLSVAVDDRTNVSVINRQKCSQFLSCPTNIIVTDNGYKIYNRKLEKVAETENLVQLYTFLSRPQQIIPAALKVSQIKIGLER